MKKWTRVGIIILIVGVSLLGGTIYRSNTTDSSSHRADGFAPNTWSWSLLEVDPKDAVRSYTFLFAPRELQIEVMATAPIDVYILDSEGIAQWEKDKTVKPLWTFKETKQDTYTLQVSKRDKYLLLIYNPTSENVTSELHIMIYGIEKDLLYASATVIATGLVLTVGSVILTQKPFHKQFSHSTKKERNRLPITFLQ